MPKNQYLNKFLIQFDLKRAIAIANNSFKLKSRKLITNPSYQDCLVYLAKVAEQGLCQNKTISFDIEIYNEEVSCISFAFCDSEAISIPFFHADGNYFDPNQELEVMRVIANILESHDIKKCGQNVGFDTHFLLRRYGIKPVNLEDTMIAQKIIMPDYPMGLDFITSLWTDQQYYKEEGKKYFGGGGWPQLWAYNATDSLMCAEAFPKQLERLEKQNNIPTYERQRDIVPTLVYMQERGILCDVQGMMKKNEELSAELTLLQEKLNTTAGTPLNANSPLQLSKYFYGTLGHKAYKNRKTNSPTTDDLAMTRLARKGIKAAEIVQEIRKVNKILGTYLPVENGKLTKIDTDNRVRCSFNPAGTKFSRISSSENIFGTGMNMQNQPHSLLQYYLIDPGYIGYAIDLSQAENRIVAYVGNITSMIEAFEKGIDIHRLTASLIFQKPIEEISTEYEVENKIKKPCPLGDGTHDERFWGKKANHGLNYDLGYVSFALLYQMLETQAKFVVERYHMAYPGVRNSYHSMVRKMLSNGRVVTNLMKRNTLFMGKWGDALFKESYSCIPQGTVGDVINERGLNYIYYNSEKCFKTVELLLQKHDEIVFQIPKTVPLSTHAEVLFKVKHKLETPLVTFDNREFVVPADISILQHSFSKRDAVELKSKNFPGTIDLLTTKLEELTNAEKLK
jgi:DNA polymerase-1